MYWARLAVLAMVGAEFIPTNEWQAVPEGVAVPGGLDIQLNMQTGERLAKLPDGAVAEDFQVAAADEHPHKYGDIVPVKSRVDTSKLNLDVLEDMAHDIDHGQEILANHYPGLIQLFEDPSETLDRRDQAGKIIGVSLRSNPNAVKEVQSQDPQLFHRLGLDTSNITPRAMMILTNLVSTKSGMEAYGSELGRFQKRLGEINWSAPTARKLRGLLEDVASIDTNALTEWAVSLQNALPAVSSDDGSRHELLKLLVDIFQRKDQFSGVAKQKTDYEFMKWLSDQSTRTDTKRDEATSAYLQYVKSVIHRVFGNPKAGRVHFDEL